MKKKQYTIAVTGVESTGKSQLVIDLAASLGANYTEEYARAYILLHGLPKTKAALDTIALHQLRLWEAAKTTNERQLFIADTDFINFKIWYEFYHWQVPDFVEQHLKNSFFDFILLTDTDIPWTADGIRINEKERDLLHNRFLYYLNYYQIPYALVSGTGTLRVANAQKALKALL